jgi:cation diffusion facilitator family transporter
VQRIGVGIAVVAFSMVVNLIVPSVIARTARATDSPALEGDAAHLRTDAFTSLAVLVGLALVAITGAYWLDPVVALLVAASIVVTGVRLLSRSSRVLVDKALPAEEVEANRGAVESFGPRGVVGYHELRTRRAGARRYVDLHVQFRHGTSLGDAHRTIGGG